MNTKEYIILQFEDGVECEYRVLGSEDTYPRPEHRRNNFYEGGQINFNLEANNGRGTEDTGNPF